MIGVPILMYHRVTKSVMQRSKLAVPLADFTEQMALLAELHITVLTLDQFLEGHRACQVPQLPAAVLTFDDGYAATCANVEYICGRYGFPATLFLTTGTVGRRDPMNSCEEGTLTWDDIRALRHLDVNAHTVRHPRLSHLHSSCVREEVRASKAILEDKLGRAIRHFAYPFGGYTRMVTEEVRSAGYRSGCAVHIGPATRNDDPFRLHRVNIDGRDSLDIFRRKIQSGFGSRRERTMCALYAPLIRLSGAHDLVEEVMVRHSESTQCPRGSYIGV